MINAVNSGDTEGRVAIPEYICAIVVTYHPDEKLQERLERLIGQVDKLVVVDNGSPEPIFDMIANSVNRLGAHLIANKENLGIAAALNKGVNFAINHGHRWALTMDQDTLAHPTMVENLVNAYRDCPFRGKVGVIGSHYQEWGSGRSPVKIKADNAKTWQEINLVLTSGTLMSIPIFQKVGTFREDLFIDSVDIEYCFRLRSNGYRIIMATHPGMTHSLGDSEVIRFMGMTGALWHHPPYRNYYIARNTLLITRKYFMKDTAWVLSNLGHTGFRLLATILFEQEKIANIKYIGEGLYHGLISKSGKCLE